MGKYRIGLLELVIGLSITLAGQAAAEQGNGTKIGFIDMREIIYNSDAGKQAMADFKKTFEKKKILIQQTEAELKRLKNTLDKQRSVLKEEAMREKEMNYQLHYRDYQRLVSDSNEELSARDKQLSQKLVPEVMKVVNAMGEKEGYGLIVDTNNPIVVFHSKADNLTKRIIAEMNKRNK